MLVAGVHFSGLCLCGEVAVVQRECMDCPLGLKKSGHALR